MPKACFHHGRRVGGTTALAATPTPNPSPPGGGEPCRMRFTIPFLDSEYGANWFGQIFAPPFALASSSAFSTLGGDMGRSAKRIPVASAMALAMAAMGGTMGVSPTPRTP